MMFQQGLPNALDGLEVFVLFARFDNDVNGRIAAQPIGHFGQPKWSYVFIGEDEDLGGFRKHRSHAPHIPLLG